MPDGSVARQRAFQFNLPRLGEDLPEVCRFTIVARTEDGFEHTPRRSRLRLTRRMRGPCHPFSGPIRSEVTADGVPPDAVMYVERATIDDDGWLSVCGWTVAFSALESIWVLVGERRIGEARAGAARPDVAAIFPRLPERVVVRASACRCHWMKRTAGRGRFGWKRCTRTASAAAKACRSSENDMETDPEMPRSGQAPTQAIGDSVTTLEPAAGVAPEPAAIEMYCDAALLTVDGFFIG